MDDESLSSLTPVDPTSDDVLCGAGHETTFHPGNVKFRQIVSVHFPKYVAATSKKSKIEVSRAILADVLSSGARFLKKNSARTCWHVAHVKVGKDKISHCLRSLKTNHSWNDSDAGDVVDIRKKANVKNELPRSSSRRRHPSDCSMSSQGDVQDMLNTMSTQQSSHQINDKPFLIMARTPSTPFIQDKFVDEFLSRDHDRNGQESCKPMPLSRSATMSSSSPFTIPEDDSSFPSRVGAPPSASQPQDEGEQGYSRDEDFDKSTRRRSWNNAFSAFHPETNENTRGALCRQESSQRSRASRRYWRSGSSDNHRQRKQTDASSTPRHDFRYDSEPVHYLSNASRRRLDSPRGQSKYPMAASLMDSTLFDHANIRNEHRPSHRGTEMLKQRPERREKPILSREAVTELSDPNAGSSLSMVFAVQEQHQGHPRKRGDWNVAPPSTRRPMGDIGHPTTDSSQEDHLLETQPTLSRYRSAQGRPGVQHGYYRNERRDSSRSRRTRASAGRRYEGREDYHGHSSGYTNEYQNVSPHRGAELENIGEYDPYQRKYKRAMYSPQEYPPVSHALPSSYPYCYSQPQQEHHYASIPPHPTNAPRFWPPRNDFATTASTLPSGVTSTSTPASDHYDWRPHHQRYDFIESSSASWEESLR